MTKHPNAVKLDASFIPTWTHKVTLGSEGYLALQETISERAFVENGLYKTYYIQSPDTKRQSTAEASKVATLLAKHLRLSGTPVIWCSLATLIREQRVQYMDKEVESHNPVLTTRGKGYIVVPDLFLDEDPSAIWPLSALRDVGSYLSSHVYNEGGLVIAGLGTGMEGIRCFGEELQRLIATRADIQRVKVQA